MLLFFSIENSLDNFSHVGGLGILVRDLFLEFKKKEKEAIFFSILPLKRSKVEISENKIEEKYEEKILTPEYCYNFQTNWYPVRACINIFPGGTQKTKAIFVTLENNEEWLKNYALYREKDHGQIIFVRYVFYLAVKKYLEENHIYPTLIHINESDTTLFFFLPIEFEINSFKIYHSHTPLPIGHKTISKEVLESLLPRKMINFLEVGFQNGKVNLGKVAAHYADKIITVSKLHERITKERIYPQYRDKITSVTNGINIEEWLGDEIKKLYDEKIPGWRKNLELIEKIDEIEGEKILEAKEKERQKTVNKIKELLNEGKAYGNFSNKGPILLYAKRLTRYKRPEASTKAYLFLKQIENVNLVVAGYPVDEYGKYFLENDLLPLLESESIVYIPNYDKEIAKYLFSGCDICLNPQEVEKEASGTSFMKCLINGNLLLTTNAGSVPEFVKDKYNALVLSDNLENLEEKLFEAHRIIKEKDLEIMRNALRVAYNVSTERMLKDLERIYSRN